MGPLKGGCLTTHCTGRRRETLSRERPRWSAGHLVARPAGVEGGAGEFQRRWAGESRSDEWPAGSSIEKR